MATKRRVAAIAGYAALCLIWSGSASASVPDLPPGCGGPTNTQSATGLPAVIPDSPAPNIPGTLTSSLTAAGLPTQILDVDVRVSIAHTFNADIDAFLVSPQGTEITLSTDNGGGADNVFRGTRFDDQAPQPVGDFVYANLVAATRLAPEEPLAALDGENPNGVWQLRVQDDASGDSGSLESWSIVVTAQGGTAGPITSPVQNTITFIPPGFPIPDNSPGGVVNGLGFTPRPDPIWRYELELDVTHTAPDNLDMTVTSPAGTAAVLSTDNGSTADDAFHGTLFTPGAGLTNPPGPVGDAAYVVGVTETPVAAEQGGAFRGESAGGTWKVTFEDDTAGDTGSIHSLTLRLFTANCRAADLSLALAGSPDRVPAGSNGIFVASARNDGPGTAANVALQNTLPAGATLIAAGPSQGSCAGAGCSLGNIAAGGVAQVVLVARLDQTGNATATAAVTSPTTETAPANNSASATIGVDPAADAQPVLVMLVGSPPKLRAALRKGVTALVGCTEACRIAGALRADAKTAKRFKLKKGAPVAKGTARLNHAGTGKLKLKFTRAAKKRLAHARTLELVLTGVATDSAGQRGNSRATLRLNR